MKYFYRMYFLNFKKYILRAWFFKIWIFICILSKVYFISLEVYTWTCCFLHMYTILLYSYKLLLVHIQISNLLYCQKDINFFLTNIEFTLKKSRCIFLLTVKTQWKNMKCNMYISACDHQKKEENNYVFYNMI